MKNLKIKPKIEKNPKIRQKIRRIKNENKNKKKKVEKYYNFKRLIFMVTNKLSKK